MYKSSETEYIINRSRFIGRCFPVKDEEAALSLLADIRKKHWDATHNCFAYRIARGRRLPAFPMTESPAAPPECP